MHPPACSCLKIPYWLINGPSEMAEGWSFTKGLDRYSIPLAYKDDVYTSLAYDPDAGENLWLPQTAEIQARSTQVYPSTVEIFLSGKFYSDIQPSISNISVWICMSCPMFYFLEWWHISRIFELILKWISFQIPFQFSLRSYHQEISSFVVKQVAKYVYIVRPLYLLDGTPLHHQLP